MNYQQATLQERAPQELSDRLAGFINDTWTIAMEMANERLNTERAAPELMKFTKPEYPKKSGYPRSGWPA